MAYTGPFRKYSRRAKIFSGVLLLLASLGLILAVFALPTRSEAEPSDLTVSYLDVGKGGLIGDAILLVSSEGKVALIDGGYPGSGILQNLKERGIKHIDLIIVTHAHDDHMGGLTEVIRAIPVERVAYNRQRLISPMFNEFEQAVHKRRAYYDIVLAGSKLPFGSLTFQVLAPSEFDPLSINNSSLVLRLVDRNVTFLFTGDAETPEEDWLIKEGAPLRADILKIAHHGSNTSTSPSFIARVKPAVAIYSAGQGNGFGLPDQFILDNLAASEAQIFGTDRNGTITVRTDGDTYTVTPERGTARETHGQTR